MKKNIARKCLCLAFASAVVLGGTVTALAAQETDPAAYASGSSGVVAEQSQAQVADSAPYIYYMSAYENDGKIKVYGSGTAKRVCVWINGVLVKDDKKDNDDSFWTMDMEINGRRASSYSVVMTAYNTAGDKVTNTAKVNTELTYVNSESAGVNVSTGSTGYAQNAGILIEARFAQYFRGNAIYQIYRATKANGKYSLIATKTAGYDDGISYTDKNVKPGVTYYYKIKLATGKDSYVKTNKTYAESKVVSARAAYPEVYNLSAYSGIDDKNRTCVSLSMNSGLANQYDIYRSTKKTNGYKKIKTVYSSSYYDYNLKRGTVYYYKVLPKYYDKASRKTYSGKMSDPVAVKYIMTGSWVTLTQISNTALKAEWSDYAAQKSKDISYEVWYRRTDIAGIGYKKALTTKKDSCVLKNLAPNGTYYVKIRTVKKAGTVVKYEDTSTSSLIMGYTDTVQGLGSSVITSAVDSAKKTLAVRYKITWTKDWGASGYIIKAYNNYTGKEEKIATIKSWKKTSYIFRNTGTKTAGVKYKNIKVIPYRGSAVGKDNSTWGVTSLDSAKNVKVVRAGNSSVKVTWKAVPGAKKYIVHRSTELGVGQIIGETTHTYFVDAHVTNDYQYTYYVTTESAYSGFESGYASYWVGYTHRLATPKVTGMANTAAGTVTIRCAKVANAKSYVVYRSSTKNGTYKKVGRLASNLTFVDRKLAKGKSYYYKVVAFTVNDGGKTVRSSASAVKGIVIKK